MSGTSLYVAVAVVVAVAAVSTWVIRRRARSGGSAARSALRGRSYMDERYGLSLLHVEPGALDEEVRTVLANFASSSPEGRSSLASTLSTEDGRTLLQFGKRCAVLALREADPKHCAEGLRALSAVDVSRLNPAELRVTAGVIDAVAATLGANRDELFDNAIDAALPSTAKALSSFHRESSCAVPLQDWGYQIADTARGPGLVETEFDEYAPSRDLLALAVRASEVIRAEDFPFMTFKVGTSVAPVWIRSKHARASKVLDGATGTAMISLSTGARGPDRQVFNVYFAELSSEDDALWLANAAPNDEPGVRATVAFSAGRVVCLGVTASRTEGKASSISWASLKKALAPVEDLMVKELGSGHAIQPLG